MFTWNPRPVGKYRRSADWHLIHYSCQLFCPTSSVHCYSRAFSFQRSDHSRCRSLNSDAFGQAVIQLVGSMLALDACLLIAYNRYKFDGVHPCTIVSVLAHFFTIASFLWMTVAGHCLLVACTSAGAKSTPASAQVTAAGEAVVMTTVADCRSLSRRLFFAWGLVFVFWILFLH